MAISRTGSPPPIPLPTPIPTLAPTPTPTPLTFSQLNSAYGPCIYLPVIFYHHITDSKSFPGLSVSTSSFIAQMHYFSTHGYTTISPTDLLNFFDHNQSLPSKPLLITFDDAYSDFATSAWPILHQLGLQATVFVPTGLINNPGYLTWNDIESIHSQGLIYFTNHTWSHHQVATAPLSIIQSEIDTAALQLADHGFKFSPVFAYPYGTPSVIAENYLQKQGYELAFTTTPGRIQCKAKRLVLPRSRMGGSLPPVYGL